MRIIGQVPRAEEVEQLAEVCRSHFGECPRELVVIPTFEDTLVYEIRFPGAEYILKTTRTDDTDCTNVEVEAHMCMLTRAQGIPTPEVVVLDTSESSYPRTYFIMRKTQGLPFRKAGLSDILSRTLLSQLGHHLRSLHSIQLPGYGALDAGYFHLSGQMRGSSSSWYAHVCDLAGSDFEYLQAFGLLRPQELDHIARVLQHHDWLLREPWGSGLLHGDFTLEHIWVNVTRDGIAAIIDFGDVVIGDPAWDFASSDWESEAALLCLLDGYGPVPGAQDCFRTRLRLYRVMYAMRVLVWSHEHNISAPTSFAAGLRKSLVGIPDRANSSGTWIGDCERGK